MTPSSATLFAEGLTPHISLPAEVLFHIGPIAITNSMLLGVIGYGVLIAVMLYVARSIKRGTTNRFVLAIQWVFEILFETIEQVLNDKVLARRLAPLAITLFFVIITNYWFGVLPFVGPITYNGVPLFRGLVADLNVTFALAIISMVMAQVYAVRVHGFGGNLKRYFRNPFKNVTGAFEGILELIAEFSRLTALSLRLFGNVFAGDVLLLMVGLLSNWAAPLTLPFFQFFEFFIGAVQAYVFFMLTVVFISLGTTAHHDEPEHTSDPHSKDSKGQPVAAGGNDG